MRTSSRLRVAIGLVLCVPASIALTDHLGTVRAAFADSF